MKCRWLLQQAVPAVMLVMQVIDETKQRRYLVSWDEQIYVSSDEPISGNSADKQNGPPMNADKRRWNKDAVLIGVYPRSSAAKYQASELSSRPASRWSTPHAQFSGREVSSGFWITPQPIFKPLNE